MTITKTTKTSDPFDILDTYEAAPEEATTHRRIAYLIALLEECRDEAARRGYAGARSSWDPTESDVAFIKDFMPGSAGVPDDSDWRWALRISSQGRGFTVRTALEAIRRERD